MGEGWVELTGSVTCSGLGTGPICTLQLGYRPDTATRRIPAAGSPTPAVVAVTTSGSLSAYPVGAATFAAGATVYLDGVTFPIGGA
jgi:hypothetical protein